MLVLVVVCLVSLFFVSFLPAWFVFVWSWVGLRFLWILLFFGVVRVSFSASPVYFDTFLCLVWQLLPTGIARAVCLVKTATAFCAF